MADLAAVTQDIRSLLISAPNGLTPSMLEKDYKDVVGCSMPYRKFGYYDCLSFVRSIPETVRISMNGGKTLLFGIADKSTEHIFKMVKNQKRAKFYSSLSGPPRKLNQTSRLPHSCKNLSQANDLLSTSSIIPLETSNAIFTSLSNHTSYRNTTTTLKSLPEASCSEKLKFTGSSGSLHEKPQDFISNISTHTTRLDKTQKNTTRWKKTLTQSKSSSDSDCGTSSFASNSSPALTLLQNEILKLLEDCTNGICSTEVPGRYKRKFHKELDLHKHGYYSIVEFFVSMTDRVHMCRLSRCGDWLLKLRSNMHISEVEGDGSAMSSNKQRADISKIEKDIKELTNKYKGGIVIKSLEDIYEMHFGRGLPMKELGVQSVAELMCLITDKIDILNNELCLRSSTVSFATKPPEQPIESAPIDAVGRGVCYKPPTIPCAEWGFFDCFVAHVSTPEDFMIQVISEQTTAALDIVMNEIEKDYNHPNAKEYKMPPHMAKKGQICIALFQGDNNWNRAVINSDPQSGFVDVLYVDYGDVTSVSIDSLYLMKSKFLSLPALMIRCRLAHLKPPDLENWTPDAKRVILDLSRNKPMVAQVISSDNSNKLSLVLCDTSQPNVDVYLNDVLLEKSLAVLVPDDATPAQLLTIRKNVEMKKAEERQHATDRSIPEEAPPPYQARDTMLCAEVAQQPETGSASLLATANTTSATRKQTRYLKPYLLQDNITIHVINYEGNAMVTSGEISSLFRPDANDLLVPMLLLKDLDFPELALENVDKHTELFLQFKALKVKGTFSGTALKSIVTLYRLSDVPAIIDGLDHNNKTSLKKQFAQMILSFDPAAPHWFQDEDLPPVTLSEATAVPLKTPVKSSNEDVIAISTPATCSSSFLNNATCLPSTIADTRSKTPSVSLGIAETKQDLEHKRGKILQELMEHKGSPPNPRLLECLQDIFRKISLLDKTSNPGDDVTNAEDDQEANIRKIWSDVAPTVSQEKSSKLEQMFSHTSLPKPFTPRSASLAAYSLSGQQQKSPNTSLVATITPFIPSTQRGSASSAPMQESRTVTTTSIASAVCSYPPGLPPPSLPPVVVSNQVWYCLTTMRFLPHPCQCVTSQTCWVASKSMTSANQPPPPPSWTCPPQPPVMRCLPPPPPGLTLPSTQGNYFLL